MRVLVCGGRYYRDAKKVDRTLDAINNESPAVSVIIHGNAAGADTLADNWAFKRCKPVLPFPANWKAYGRSAGAKRNKQMLREGKPDLVVAFPGGNGTANMVAIARAAGITVIEVER